jgi:CRISPR type I-E-associated protein CasB/Cse2
VSEAFKSTWLDELRSDLRAVRGAYDALPRGETAVLRRCRTAEDVALEGVFWRAGGKLAHRQVHLSHVVLLFPLARHAVREGFSFGRFLRRQIGDKGAAVLRFRRLLDSRDRNELDHRLRGLLRLACADGSAVDWGVLGADVLWFFAESGATRRRWAQDFYAPMASSDSAMSGFTA